MARCSKPSARWSASPPARRRGEVALRIDHYDWSGGREAMLRFGPATGPVVVVAMPLFEEANRTRAFVMTILRALAKQGIAGLFPDLPGTGESTASLAEVTLADWRRAFSAVTHSAANQGRVHALALRGGALIDHDARIASRWQLAPVAGRPLLRDLWRARLFADPKHVDIRLSEVPEGPPVALLGNVIGRALLIDLDTAVPAADGLIRTVRLDGDTAPADRHVPGTPLWRRAEPDNDPALAALLVDDIAGWIASCAG